MTAITTWQTDDPCPRCGARLIEISGPSSDRVIQQCRACAWSVTWAAPQLVLTAAQSDCLADMAADAIAYRRAAATGCPHCRQSRPPTARSTRPTMRRSRLTASSPPI
jgi:hypothetical protein